MRHMYFSSSGFTLVELLVVIMTLGILAGVLFGPLNSMYNDNVTSARQIIQTGDIRGALRAIESDVSYAASFNSGLTSDVTSPDPTNTTWTYSGGSGGIITDSGTSVLITATYATDNAPTDTSRNLVFDPASPLNTVKNNTVYFVQSGVLYRRLEKTKNTSVTVWQKQTCSVGYINSGCQAADAKILTGVTGFTVAYFANAWDTTPLSSPAGARTALISLTQTAGSGTQALTKTVSLRISPTNIGVTP